MDSVVSLERNLQVRFVVFAGPHGPILSYSDAAPFAPWVASDNGLLFKSTEEMGKALDKVGLPGPEIATMFNSNVYSVTDTQLRALGFVV
jgi:hypothetical protein